MKNEVKSICDHCKNKEADSSHAILTELNLCSSCSMLLKDDKLSKCETCGGDSLDCLCGHYTIQDAENELNEVSDLCVCLFILSDLEEIKQFPGKPHLTLLNIIGNKVMDVSINLKATHE